MFPSGFSSLASCSYSVLSMGLVGSFLGVVRQIRLFSGFTVSKTLLRPVDVDGLMLDFASVNMGICLDGRFGHGES
jgi:hypothetical protein